MPYILDAACLCSTGKIRKNNEDNFFFDERCMEVENNGLKHPVSMTRTLRRELCVAVFDGMGGENFGEYASFAAADCMQYMTRKLKDYFIPERKFLNSVCMRINDAVVAKQKELCTDRMGSTMVARSISPITMCTSAIWGTAGRTVSGTESFCSCRSIMWRSARVRRKRKPR